MLSLSVCCIPVDASFAECDVSTILMSSCLTRILTLHATAHRALIGETIHVKKKEKKREQREKMRKGRK